MDKNQLPKEIYEIISGVLKFVEKSETDFIENAKKNLEGDNENENK